MFEILYIFTIILTTIFATQEAYRQYWYYQAVKEVNKKIAILKGRKQQRNAGIYYRG